jgi:cytochrome c oxidase subunit 1
MFIAGYSGMQRRIYNPYEYNFLKHLLGLNQFIGVWVAIAFFAQFIFVYNVIKSMKSGKVAGNNPWGVGTLEWTIASPAPFHNFEKIPTVVTGPHEFNNPKFAERDFIYQNEFVEGVSHKAD